MRAYAQEALVALAAVQSASRAALSLQREIAVTKAAYQKEELSGTGFGAFSPVTVGDFMVQVNVLGCLARAFPDDRFIAEESGGELLAAGAETRAALMDAVATHDAPLSEAEALQTLDLGRTGVADGWSRSGRTWVLDPIDGTKGFLRGEQFCVALSLLDGGQPVRTSASTARSSGPSAGTARRAAPLMAHGATSLAARPASTPMLCTSTARRCPSRRHRVTHSCVARLSSRSIPTSPLLPRSERVWV